jgi:hypothetical protein
MEIRRLERQLSTCKDKEFLEKELVLKEEVYKKINGWDHLHEIEKAVIEDRYK